MRTKLDAVSIAAVLMTVAAFSMTAPLTAYATAPALALAFGRNALGLLTLGPAFMLIRRHEVRKVVDGERLLVRKEQRRATIFGVLAGTALAVHFVTFMSSTQMTSVALATAIVATQPVWQALIATVFNKQLPTVTWVGLTVSVVGAVVASGADVLTGDTQVIVGDVLALVGAVALAVYAAFSERARPDVSTSWYSVLCFSVCTVELLVVCLVTGTPPFTFAGNSWLVLLGLLVFPQLLGLFSLNFSLGRAPATAVSVMLLLEAPVAALVAWLWLGQLPTGMAWLGLFLIMLGVAVVVMADARRVDPTAGYSGEARLPVTLPAHPFPDLGAVYAGDPHALLWPAARERRFEEIEATIRRFEVHTVQNHGADSREATRWIKARAAVAHIAGNHGLASQLWLAAARFHSSSPDRDLAAARACLDQAFHEWGYIEDNRVIAALAPALRAMYNQDPEHRPGINDAIDRRLLHVGAHGQG